MICFQELFYGPYFCQVQDEVYYEYAESVPGPTVERFQPLAHDSRMVLVLPVYEQEQPGVLYNTAAVIDADGTYLGKYRKHHIPHVKGFWEKFYFRPGNLGYPVFDTAVGRDRRLHLLRPALPRRLARARPRRRADRVQPVGDESRPLDRTSGSSSSPRLRSPTSTSSGAINRVGVEAARRRRLLRHRRTSSIHAGQLVGEVASDKARSSSSATSTSTCSPRSATSGSSTAIAVPTCTAPLTEA